MPVYYALPPTGYYITADQWMNSTALVDRLNFAYALTTGKYPNQKFDSPRTLALGLMSQPATASSAGQGNLTTAVYRSGNATALTGPEIALHVLEETLIGADASPETNQLIHKQIADLGVGTTTPTDTLDLLTALILGSPDFQCR